ncbi:MAG: hypothetical protein H8E30_04625 [Alphaproteobacteria bacterium]|nr:hypothetical protein [Alphaproteobacteria bacterium]
MILNAPVWLQETSTFALGQGEGFPSRINRYAERKFHPIPLMTTSISTQQLDMQKSCQYSQTLHFNALGNWLIAAPANFVKNLDTNPIALA